MSKLGTSLGLLTMSLSLSLAACDKGETDPANSQASQANIKTLNIPELEKLLAAPDKPAIYDANSAETRAEYGIIPGAKLLSSNREYDVKGELPNDKATPLVFYCGSTKCQAAEGAADKAVLAGYSDVGVMRDGIKGWAKAGKPTSQVN